MTKNNNSIGPLSTITRISHIVKIRMCKMHTRLFLLDFIKIYYQIFMIEKNIVKLLYHCLNFSYASQFEIYIFYYFINNIFADMNYYNIRDILGTLRNSTVFLLSVYDSYDSLGKNTEQTNCKLDNPGIFGIFERTYL